LIADCDPPPLLSVFKWCDLRGDNRRRRRQLDLLAVRITETLNSTQNKPPVQFRPTLLEQSVARASPAFPRPDPKDEELISNLVRLVSIPGRVWCATLLDDYGVFTRKLNKENRTPFIYRSSAPRFPWTPRWGQV
jgi:hypothetical protein